MMKIITGEKIESREFEVLIGLCIFIFFAANGKRKLYPLERVRKWILYKVRLSKKNLVKYKI